MRANNIIGQNIESKNLERYIIKGKPEDVALADRLIYYQTFYHKKLTGVKIHMNFDLIPFSKLHMDTAETLHCTNMNANILYEFLLNEKNFPRFTKNSFFNLNKEASALFEKHKNKHSDEFLDSYVQTVQKVKTRAIDYSEEIDKIFPQKIPTKKLDAKEVLIAIKESRFDYRTGEILEYPYLFHKLWSKKSLREGVASFLAKFADDVNPDKYLDYYNDQKYFLKWYNVLSRKIIHFFKNH